MWDRMTKQMFVHQMIVIQVKGFQVLEISYFCVRTVQAGTLTCRRVPLAKTNVEEGDALTGRERP